MDIGVSRRRIIQKEKILRLNLTCCQKRRKLIESLISLEANFILSKRSLLRDAGKDWFSNEFPKIFIDH